MQHYVNELTALLAILFGAFVGAIKKVRDSGWKGWLWFFTGMFVNIFVGLVAFLIAQEYGFSDRWQIIVALIFGFVGEKAGNVIIEEAINFIKAKAQNL